MTDAAPAQSSVRTEELGRFTYGYAGITIYIFCCFLLGIFHLLMGAEPYVVFLALASIVVSIIPAVLYGWRDLPSLFAILLCMRYVTSALVWKLVEWAPLDEGLYAPTVSFQVILVGTTAVTLAALAAHIIWHAKPLYTQNLNERGFAFLLCVSAVLAALSLTLGFSGTRLAGGVEALISDGMIILPMAYMGFNIYSSRAVMSPGLLLMLIGFTLISLAFNSRQGALTMILAAFVMYTAYGFKLHKGLLVGGITAALLFAFVIAPAMTDARSYRDIATPTEMIGHTFDAIGKRLTGEALDAPFDPDRSRYRAHYVKASNHFIERAVSVQQLDFLVALVANNGAIGTDRFYLGLYEMLPSFIVTEKEIGSRPSYAFSVYNIFGADTESRVEATAYGTAFSYGEYQFLFFSVLIGFFLVFFFFRLFCPRFENSIFAAFILLAYLHSFSSGNIWSTYSAISRSLPFEALLFGIANLISRTKPVAEAA